MDDDHTPSGAEFPFSVEKNSFYAAQVLCVGGTSARTQRALVAMLREIIENGLKNVYRGFCMRGAAAEKPEAREI
jgi:hypothetical protein